jgi:hypothetical protein
MLMGSNEGELDYS